MSNGNGAGGTAAWTALGLSDPDPHARQVALTELRENPELQAVEPLLGALADPDAVVRRLAIEILEELGDARAIDGLIGRLRDPDPDVQSAAQAALREFRGED